MTLAPRGSLLRPWKSPAARTLLVAGGAGVLCKAVALGRELLIAERFGASDLLDAFLVAVIVPVTVANVVGNVLATSLLPQLLNVRREAGPAAEIAAQQRALFWSIALLAMVGTLFAMAGPWLLLLLSPGFAGSTRTLTHQLLWAATPFGVIAGATRIYAVLAESDGRFVRSALSPLLTTLVSVLLLLALAPSPFILVAGLTIGAATELAFNAASLSRTRYRPWPRPGALTSFETGLVAVAWPVSLGSFLHGLTVVVDQSFASLAGPGAVSELTYGIRFVAVATGLIGTPLFAYTFPRFARLVAERQFVHLRREFRRYALLSLLVGLPPMVLLSAGSAWIVEATFQRGRFSAEAAQQVALVQSLSALQIPFAIVAMLGLRCVFALKLRHVMLYQGTATVLADIALNDCLLRWLGVPGIALATTILSVGACGFMLVVVERAIRREIAADARPAAHASLAA